MYDLFLLETLLQILSALFLVSCAIDIVASYW